MNERRGQPRQRVLKSGKIATNQRVSVFDCTIRNLSLRGACIEMGSTIGVPQSFELTIEPDGVSRACKVIWRSERRIGVAFL
ncbi:MAG: PilZ domain-containing protein [Pseudomonadota bacterium]